MKADRKPFTKATQRQLAMKERVIESVKQNTGVYLDVAVSHESVYDFNGKLAFIVKTIAKPDTGMIFLTEKSWLVTIGRKGAVYSMNVMGNKNPKRNKYLLFH